MVIVLLIAATLIFIGIVILVIRRAGGAKTVPTGRDRFKAVGPGEVRPKVPRATGLN